LPCDLSQSDLSKPVPQRTEERKRRVPANQGREVHQHGSDNGDEGEVPGLTPTESEMLSASKAETGNRGQEQIDGAQEDLLPDDMEDLSEHGEGMSVTEDSSPSDSETEKETLTTKRACRISLSCAKPPSTKYAMS